MSFSKSNALQRCRAEWEVPVKRKNDAFTLIELLVVIAIIAILAGILFPVFAQARAKARQVVCMNNEKQLAAALLMYAQDYDERWTDAYPNYNANLLPHNYNIFTPNFQPLWITPRDAPCQATFFNPCVYKVFNGVPYTTQYLMKPYVKNDNVQYCPTLHYDRVKYIDGSAETANHPDYALNALGAENLDSPYATAPKPGEISASYLNPAYLPPDYYSDDSGLHWYYTGPGGRTSAQFWHPASLITIWEHSRAAAYCNTWAPHDPVHWDASHHGGFNAAFADGHVKRLTLGAMRNQYVCYWQLPE